MVQKEVIDYVANGRNQGFSDSVLKQKLVEGGYTEDEISEAFGSVSSTVEKKNVLPREEKSSVNVSSQAGSVPWIKVSSWIGTALFAALFLFGVLLLVYPDGVDSLLSNKVIFLALFIVGMSGMALFYSGFIKIGKSLNNGRLAMGSWLLIVSFFLALVVSIIGNSIGSASFQIMFTILSMSLSIVFVVGVIGQFLFSWGLTKTKRDIRFAGLAGIINWIMLVVFLLFAISFVVLSFAMINEISELSTRTVDIGINSVFEALGKDSGAVMFFTVMFGTYYLTKVLKLVFDVLVLRNGSRRFES